MTDLANPTGTFVPGGVEAGLRWYVDALEADKPFTQDCHDTATAMVTTFIGKSNPYGVPGNVVNRAVLEVAADLWYRRMQSTGADEMGDMSPSPFRITRNPMTAAYSLLRPWVPVSLA